MTDQIRDNGAVEPNPGLSATIPDVQFIGGDITPGDFARMDPISAGHQRRSPGDGPQDGGGQHRAFYSELSGKAAEVDEASLGPGVLPTALASSPSPHPIRAADFARGFGEHVPGQQDPSPGNPLSRGPMSPEQAFGLGQERMRGDNLQSDQQPSPKAGNRFPDSAGRSGSGDDAQHRVVRPTIDDSPSIGGNLGGIFKDAEAPFAKKVE